MKQVKDIANRIKRAQTEQMPSSSVSSEKVSGDTDKWASTWRMLYGMGLIFFDALDEKTGEETRDYTIWRRGVADLSNKELDNGVVKARDFKGFFNLPKFRDLCRVSNTDLGLPESKQAYYEACLAPSPKVKQRYSHPIVYMAGQAAGWFNLTNDSESKAFKHYDHHYQIFVERVKAGEKFQVQAAIAHKQGDAFKAMTPEEHEQNIKKFKDLKSMLKG